MNGFQPYCEQKVWGEVLHVFASPHAAVSYLKVEQGSWCSVHLHTERANVFVSLSAVIEVIEFREDGAHLYYVGAGGSHEVPSRVKHQFKVLQSGEVIEIYYADRGGEVRLDDIVRFSEGGKSDGEIANDSDGSPEMD